MFRRAKPKNQVSIGAALSTMDDILGGDPVVAESEFVDVSVALGGSARESTSDSKHDSKRESNSVESPDFPIYDPVLKKQFTEGFLQVYGAPPRDPVVMFDQIDGEMDYNDTPLYTPAYHIGQRKLILNEIQFLTKIRGNAIVVYAGSAPSIKGAFMAHLFPRIRFIFIDPNKFEIRPYGSISVEHTTITNDTPPADAVDKLLSSAVKHDICTARVYMTAGIAAEFGRRYADGELAALKIAGFKSPELYFISDIRTNIDDVPPTSFDIMWNSAQHINWILQMKPARSMLKFRCPFFNETNDELAEYEARSRTAPYSADFDAAETICNLRTFTSREFSYFDGEIYLQPWAPISSTESRLVFDGIPTVRKYDRVQYENKFYYYNKLLRPYQYYKNPNADRGLGFDHCADCALENAIWTDYCAAAGVSPDAVNEEIHHYVGVLSELTFRQLKHGQHGNAFGRLPINEILRRHIQYKEQPRRK